MKSIISDFHMMIQQYTLKSMLKRVLEWSFNVYNNPDKEFGHFTGIRAISLTQKVWIVQTWMIDLVYDLISYNRYGSIEMTSEQALIMIAYYNKYKDDNSGSHRHRKSRTELHLYLYGFFGEQVRFQDSHFFEEYAREKYILEKGSQKSELKIDIKEDFFSETHMTIDKYSEILYFIIKFFETQKPYITEKEFEQVCSIINIPFSDIESVKNRYTITLDGIRNSSLRRQVLYTNPFIIFDDELYSANPYLLLCLFANSYYWTIRNKYKKMHKQDFTNAFGEYFETYVEEILNNTVEKDDFFKIPIVENQKRADWKIKLGKYDVLVEQKSSLPFFSIKQNETDVYSIKKYIIKCWGEAIEQLKQTEIAYSLNNSIKIILVYDQYFKAEALENMFYIRNDIKNDGYYWLVNIRDFEMLMMLYKDNKKTFDGIMSEKIKAETSNSKDGRDLSHFFEKHDIYNNDYLWKFGIYNEFTKITDHMLSDANVNIKMSVFETIIMKENRHYYSFIFSFRSNWEIDSVILRKELHLIF